MHPTAAFLNLKVVEIIDITSLNGACKPLLICVAKDLREKLAPSQGKALIFATLGSIESHKYRARYFCNTGDFVYG